MISKIVKHEKKIRKRIEKLSSKFGLSLSENDVERIFEKENTNAKITKKFINTKKKRKKRKNL